MLGSHLTPSLAESWTVSPDQTAYEFKLRQGLKFHNGDPFTAEDVKFSFQRARANILHEKVREVVIVDPYRVRFVLHEPWPDDLLRHVRLGRRMDRAEEVHRAGRRRWLPEASRWARPLPVPEHHTRCGTGPAGLRGLPAQGAVAETDVLQSRARAPHAACPPPPGLPP